MSLDNLVQKLVELDTQAQAIIESAQIRAAQIMDEAKQKVHALEKAEQKELERVSRLTRDEILKSAHLKAKIAIENAESDFTKKREQLGARIAKAVDYVVKELI